MKLAALDLGSNTFLCLIAEVENNQIKKVLDDQVEVVRLGQGLNQNKKFHPEALQRADACLNKFSSIISKHKPDKVLAMATSAARDAENQNELFEIGKKYNIPIEIIPGNKEAEITYKGSVSKLSDSQQNILVVDIGGGSTEFIFGQGETVLAGKSFDIGCVRLTEKFITSQPTSEQEVNSIVNHVDSSIFKALENKPRGFKIDQIVAVAGTPTTLAAVEIGAFIKEKIDGYVFSEAQLEMWLRKFQSMSVADKIRIGVPEGRADVILVGVIILLRTLKIFKIDKLTVSTRGVRYGVALEMARRYNS